MKRKILNCPDVLPKEYKRFNDQTIKDLLKSFSNVCMDVEGDVFGQIYEYFLGKFAMSEGQKGGEFFTPASIMKLIVEVLEPYRYHFGACLRFGRHVCTIREV